MRLNLKIWRQAGPNVAGRLVDYPAPDVSPDMSFLEMLDVVNEGLVRKGEDAIAFDSDCREGICGMCSLVVNGVPHGPDRGTTVCQLHMRRFKDGDTIVIEPWRARAFPILKDLVVDRSALDRIIGAGGYTSINVGSAPPAAAAAGLASGFASGLAAGAGLAGAALLFEAALCASTGDAPHTSPQAAKIVSIPRTDIA